MGWLICGLWSSSGPVGKQHNSSRIGSTQLDPSLVTVVSFISISDLCFKMCAQTCPVIIMKIKFVSSVFSDAFVQCDSGAFPSLPGRNERSVEQTPVQSERRWLGFGLRCISEAGRRGSPGGWTSSSSSISCLPFAFPAASPFFPQLIFIWLLKPRAIFTKT